MIGIEYLWGKPVLLETSEPEISKKSAKKNLTAVCAVLSYKNYLDSF